MKQRTLLAGTLLAFSLLTACSDTENTDNANTTATVPADTTTATAASSPDSESDLMALKAFKDAYPSDVNLLDQPQLKPRLEKLLGAEEYARFRKYWNTETPIQIENDVLYTSGCEVHNCGVNQYILQVDLRKDNINVYHIGKELKSYQENGPVDLPPVLAKEFHTLRENMSI